MGDMEIMDIVVIVADLGHFKAYRVSVDPMKIQSSKMKLVESFDTLEAHKKASDKFSDAAGRFKRAGGDISDTTAGYGERHNIELETEKRLIKLTAENISEVVQKEGCEKWYLAASKQINNALLEHLDPLARDKLEKNIKADLTNMGKSDILSHLDL